MDRLINGRITIIILTKILSKIKTIINLKKGIQKGIGMINKEIEKLDLVVIRKTFLEKIERMIEEIEEEEIVVKEVAMIEVVMIEVVTIEEILIEKEEVIIIKEGIGKVIGIQNGMLIMIGIKKKIMIGIRKKIMNGNQIMNGK